MRCQTLLELELELELELLVDAGALDGAGVAEVDELLESLLEVEAAGVAAPEDDASDDAALDEELEPLRLSVL